MKKRGIVDDHQARELRNTGSRPGILFGSTKVHKVGAPLRPIVSTIDTANYYLSKYVVGLLSGFVDSSYSVKDSFSFASEISNIPNNSYFMCSFDVKNLFTMIPVDETIEIVLLKYFPNSDTIYKGFDRALFKKVLDNCAKNNLVLFNNKSYFQIDGAPMGGCISPTLAEIFLDHHERRWLEDCPVNFKPMFYRRYVDDCFLLFQTESAADSFLSYLNGKHPSIEFTCEKEVDNMLSFLDINVHKDGSVFHTGLYRKPTFTGLKAKIH